MPIQSDRVAEVTPAMLAAAWTAWRKRRQGKLGPGPAFSEAIAAALSVAGSTDPSTDRAEEMREGAAERVCHDEQMTVWTGEIAGRLSMGDYFRDDLSYDDVLDIHSALADEVRRIVGFAFEHPELRALPTQEAQR